MRIQWVVGVLTGICFHARNVVQTEVEVNDTPVPTANEQPIIDAFDAFGCTSEVLWTAILVRRTNNHGTLPQLLADGSGVSNRN
jgi:hypothetical protein